MGFHIKKDVLKKYTEEPGVTEVVVPKYVRRIDYMAFSDCSSLTCVTF